MKSILYDHFKKYPNMELSDYIKLLYQCSFGPRHLHHNPTIEQVQNYINYELQSMSYVTDRFYEEIGNGYHRLYLDAIATHKITQLEVEQLFFSSMEQSVDAGLATTTFHNGLSTLRELCKSNEIPISITTFDREIKQYLQNGIHPIHHSKTYNDLYHPHYRVIKK